MRYDDTKIESSRTKNWNNSGNESLGFESFNRDDICCLASSIDTGWCAQGTSSRTEPYSSGATLTWCDAKANSITALDSSINTLSSNASSMNNEVIKLSKQLNMLAAKMGVSLDAGANDRLDLKNQFRGGRLRRCQLQTL